MGYLEKEVEQKVEKESLMTPPPVKEEFVIEEIEEPEEIEEFVDEKSKKGSNKKATKKEETKHRIIVVRDLPTQIVRQAVSEDGTVLHYITVEEALTESLNK